MRSSRRRKGGQSVEKIGGHEDHMLLYARRSQVLWKMRLEFCEKGVWTLACEDGWHYLCQWEVRGIAQAGNVVNMRLTSANQWLGKREGPEAKKHQHNDNTTKLLINNNSLKSVEPPIFSDNSIAHLEPHQDTSQSCSCSIEYVFPGPEAIDSEACHQSVGSGLRLIVWSICRSLKVSSKSHSKSKLCTSVEFGDLLFGSGSHALRLVYDFSSLFGFIGPLHFSSSIFGIDDETELFLL